MYYHSALLLKQKSVLCVPLSYDYLIFKRFPTTPYRCTVVLLNQKRSFRIQLDFKNKTVVKQNLVMILIIHSTVYLVTKN